MKEGRNQCSDLHTQLDLYKILEFDWIRGCQDGGEACACPTGKVH